MPRMRDTTSTLMQEIDLARAYLAIIGARLGDRLHCEVDVDARIGNPAFPPMMLLPLIDHAIGNGISAAGQDRTILIAAALADGSTRFVTNDVTPRTWYCACNPNDGLPLGPDWPDD